MPRVMCVRFPSWSLQRTRWQRPDLRGRPLAILTPVAGKGSKVLARCAEARRRGVRPGIFRAEALATLPSLMCMEDDPDEDRRVLDQLARWSQRFSPVVGVEDAASPSCLFIDATGSAACFGGEDELIRKVCEEFSEGGWTVVVVLADTIGSAWAVGRHPSRIGPDLAALGTHGSSRFALIPRGGQRRCLLGLPIAALRLSERHRTLLGQLGIDRIEQLEALPRDQIAERFGAGVGLRLDQAMGMAAEVFSPFRDPPDVAAGWTFEDPVEGREVVGAILDLLLDRLQAILEERCRGTRLVECVLELEGGDFRGFECGLSRPARSAKYLGPLLHMRLAELSLPAPIFAISLRAFALEPMPDEQRDLHDPEAAEEEKIYAHFLDNLVSRLGRDAVSRARFVADPQPELACGFDCALDASPGAEESPVFRHRPLRIFPRPVPVPDPPLVPPAMPARFQYEGTEYEAIRCHGPERIETGWWRDAEIRRDYYVVEASDGTRWWLFRRIDDGRWFLHGCFD